MSTRSFMQMQKFRVSRRGRKLQISDDQRILIALPKDIPERTWSEILQKEENELACLDIREEILEEAMRIGYEKYMDRQNAFFVVHCAAEAWLKLIDWHFYRHDPGEDPSAYPPCYIPKRVESWQPDAPPEPSPPDTWGRVPLTKEQECKTDEPLPVITSSDSIQYPTVQPIPQKYWFPGRVNIKTFYVGKNGLLCRETNMTDKDGNRIAPLVEQLDDSGEWRPYVETPSIEAKSSEHVMPTESEVLQKVTDYSTEDMIEKVSTPTTPPAASGSWVGAGDSPDPAVVSDSKIRKRGSRRSRSTVMNQSRAFPSAKSHMLPPLEMSDSRVTVISDCRLRNLRLDTQFEVSIERIESPFSESQKRQ